MTMVGISWNVSIHLTRCTMCQHKVYVYSDLSCQNNGKGTATSTKSSKRPRDSVKVLLVSILYHGAGNMHTE